MADSQQPVEQQVTKTPASEEKTTTSDFKNTRHKTKKSKTCRCGHSYRRENETGPRGAEKGSYRSTKHHCQ